MLCSAGWMDAWNGMWFDRELLVGQCLVRGGCESEGLCGLCCAASTDTC